MMAKVIYQTDTQRQISPLTGIRGMAAIWVLFHHLPWLFFVDDGYSNIAIKGFLGVDLFFLLSGFILSYVYLENYNNFSTKRFYLARFARVYPVMFFMLVFAFLPVFVLGLAFGVLEGGGSFTAYKFFMQLFMLNGLGIPDSNGWNGVSWSVSAEALAYLTFPLLIVIFKDHFRSTLSILISIFVVFSISYAFAFSINNGRQYMLPSEFTSYRVLSEFILGMLLYRLWTLLSITTSGTASLKLLNLLQILAFVFVFVLSLVGSPAIFDGFYLVLFMVIIFTCACHNELFVNNLLSTKIFVWLGKISYALYLCHILVIILFNKLVARFVSDVSQFNEFIIILMIFISSIVFAVMLYEFVEKPMRIRILKCFKK